MSKLLEDPPGVEVDALGNACVSDLRRDSRGISLRPVKCEQRLALFILLENVPAGEGVVIEIDHLKNAIRWAEAKGA